MAYNFRLRFHIFKISFRYFILFINYFLFKLFENNSAIENQFYVELKKILLFYHLIIELLNCYTRILQSCPKFYGILSNFWKKKTHSKFNFYYIFIYQTHSLRMYYEVGNLISKLIEPTELINQIIKTKLKVINQTILYVVTDLQYIFFW